MDLPSGDHVGAESAKLSLVRLVICLRLQVDDEDVASAVLQRGEHDLLAVRRDSPATRARRPSRISMRCSIVAGQRRPA